MPLLTASRATNVRHRQQDWGKGTGTDVSFVKFLSSSPCSTNPKHSSAVVADGDDWCSPLAQTLSTGWQQRRELRPFATAEASHHLRNFIVSCGRGPAHSSGIEKCAQAKNVFICDLNIVDVLLKTCQEWQDSRPRAFSGEVAAAFRCQSLVPASAFSRGARPALPG